jgi:di/tricarboxylate transporter
MKIFVAISIIVLIALLIQNRYKPSVLFGGLATIYYLLGFIELQAWTSSYANSSLLILVLLLLVSISLEKTVIVEYFSKVLIQKNYKTSLLRLGILSSVFSAFLNNTAVVASLMSVIKNNKHHLPSKLLIPLSYFAIFGGTMTLVGTSTNLIVNSFVIENGLPSLEMFDFFYVGAIITIVGTITLYVFSFLLPSYENTNNKIEEHLIQTEVLEHSSLIGKSIKDNKLRNLEYLFLLEITRDKRSISPVSPDEKIELGDKLIFSGDIKHLELLKQFDGLILGGGVDIKNLTLIDTIITPQSSLIGKKVKEANFRSKFDSAIVSLRRGSLNIAKIGDEILQAGDRLVLSVGKDFENRENINKNFYVFNSIKQNEKLSNEKSLFVVMGFVATIALSAIGMVALLDALIVFMIFLLLFKTITLENIKRRFPYDFFIVIGSSLAISKVLISSGVADSLALVVTDTFGIYGVYGSFIGIYLLTLVLTELITNNAAAALSFPIAYATAIGLDVSPLPFIFAVAYGASASFILPYGYQTNLMVSSVGNYSAKDFIKIGSIVTIVYSTVVLISVPMIFEF